MTPNGIDLASLSHDELKTLAKLLEAHDRADSTAGLHKWFKPGPFSIENCPKHKAFFDAGAKYPERAFVAGNRVGKSAGGGYELACHLTGEYPEWWAGKRFDGPVRTWACGKTGVTTRDTVQKIMLGEQGHFGEGMLPYASIIDTWAKPGVPNAIDTVEVLHTPSGRSSMLTFKSYDQDVKAFYGVEREVAWLDEECPPLIYNETLLRTMTTGGIIYVTFTPLEGITPFIINYDKFAEHLAGARRMVALSEDDEKELSKNRRRTKAIITAGWDDAPWLDGDKKTQMLEDTEPHLRDARSKGIPTIGSGAVYPIHTDSLLCEPFQIPEHYKRLYGMDVGWKVTACVFAALDPDTDVLYVYDEYYGRQAEPGVHAERIKAKAKGWIPGVIDPAAHGSSQVDGKKLIHMYRQLGLSLSDAENAVESGIHIVWERMAAGKLKIFKTIVELRRELLIYSRDLNGRIIKNNDHAADAMRYVVATLKRARSRMQSTPFDGGNSFGGGQGGGRTYSY